MGFSILIGLITYLPVVMAAAVIAVIGWRGRLRWSSPMCAKCKYDLRGSIPEQTKSCPECGSDLNGRRAVLFTRAGRRWGLLAFALLILVLPWGSLGGIYLYHQYQSRAQGNPSSLPSMTTAEVLAVTAAKPDEPWAWRDLERRLGARQLSYEQVAIAIDQLITHMTTNRPDGWNEPLHWKKGFLEAAYQSNSISQEQLFALYDAFFGPAPKVDSFNRVRQTITKITVRSRYGGPWDLPFSLKPLHDVRRVTINGAAVEFTPTHHHEEHLYGSIPLVLKPGSYEVEFEFDLALIDDKHLLGFDYNTRSAQWPEALRRWTKTVKVPLSVYADDVELVGTTVDPSLDPLASGAISIESLLARDDGERKRVLLKFEINEGLMVPISFDVLLGFGGQVHPLNQLWYYRQGNSSSGSGRLLQRHFPSLPDDLAQVDIILRPNPQHIEHKSQVDHIWGREIIFEDVPITRYDQAPGTESE